MATLHQCIAQQLAGAADLTALARLGHTWRVAALDVAVVIPLRRPTARSDDFQPTAA